MDKTINAGNVYLQLFNVNYFNPLIIKSCYEYHNVECI